MEESFYTVEDVMSMLNCSQSKAYETIQKLNRMLEKKAEKENKDIMTFRGRVPAWWFKKITCLTCDK